MAARQMALVLVWKAVKEKISDDQTKHPVTKKFLAFAGMFDTVVRCGGTWMDQCVPQQLRSRKLMPKGFF